MKPYNISHNFRTIALLIVTLTTLSSLIFFFISFRQYQKSSIEKYAAINFHVVNNYKIFLDNIQKQAELLGQKILASNLSKEAQINQLLNHKFSLGVDLDTSISSNWIRFNWIEKNKTENFDYDLDKSLESPWVINFHPLHSTSTNTKDHFLPVSFAITASNGDAIGVLVSKINISDLLKFLKSGIEDDSIAIAILDENHDVVSRPLDNNLALPSNFFKDVNFEEMHGVVGKNFELTGATYMTYRKLKFYPFTVIVGNDEKKILQPFYSSFLNYSLTFVAIIAIILLLLRRLYTRVVSPINNLEIDIQELLKSYKLRNKIADETPQKISSFAQVLDDAITVIYPEIYSKKIIVNRRIEEGVASSQAFDFAIDASVLTNALSTLISFSVKFSDRGGQININVRAIADGELHIEIEDFGHGDEEWRRNNCGKKLDEILLVDQLIKNSGNEIGYINKNLGVGYFILLHSSKKTDDTLSSSHSNIIRLFPKKLPK